jgi:acyl-CoA reductase-like NAD-dependent aldehyde dehydrogenase
MIVLEDADLEKAARFAVDSSFRNAGQVCVSTERIFVADGIADEFEEHMARLTGEIKVGPGTEDGVRVGPMINDRQRGHVLAHVDEALGQGARVVTGGGEHPDHFVKPTILTDLTPEMKIMVEETFGPVACISRFTDVNDAVASANNSPFGLGAVVFGKDESRTMDVARRLDAGMIGINKGCGGASGSPWVGAKESGYGFHSSRDGHRQFTQTRVVSIPKS